MMLWILMLAGSFITFAEAIQCFCSDENHCMSGSGPEESCPNHLSVEYFKKNKIKIEAELVPSLVQILIVLEALKIGDALTKEKAAELTPYWIQNATGIISGMAPEKVVTAREAIRDIVKEIPSITGVKNDPGDKKILQKINDLFAGKAKQAGQNTDYQFCVKLIDESGAIKQACGIIASQLLGPGLEIDCHLYAVPNVIYTNYCRCETDLCNIGTITMEESEENMKSAGGKKTKITIFYQVIIAVLVKLMLVH